MKSKEIEEKIKKEASMKEKHNWDDRILRSEKMKDLCNELLMKEEDSLKK